MRVTQSTMAHQVSTALQQNLGRVQDLQGQLSSGKRITKFSDNPADAASVQRLRAQEDDWAAYSRSAEDAEAWLNTQDSALQSASTVLERARELVVSSTNGARGASERDAIASELEQLRDHLGELANTSYLGRPVFGGFAASAVQNAGGVFTFTGDGGQVNRQISPQVAVTVNGDGNQVFGFAAGAGNDMFSVISKLATDIRAGNDTAVATGLTALDARAGDIQTGLALVGSRQNQVDLAKDASHTQTTVLRSTRSEIEDVDIAQTIVDLQMAQNGYQATLAAVSRVTMPSLADYLH